MTDPIASIRRAEGEQYVPADPRPEQFPWAPVGTFKFAVLSFSTFSIYYFYWCYRNWVRVKQRTGEPMSPILRTFFTPIFLFSFTTRVHDDATARGESPSWPPILMAGLHLALWMGGRLPDPWWLISLLSFVPLVPVVRTVQAINARSDATEARNDDLSIGNILTIIVGELVLLLVVIGMFSGDVE